MKRILFLLLLTVSVYGQNPSRFAKIQITGNTTSGTATKVNVQEVNGEVNTQTINTAFNKNFGLNSGDVVGATTLLNQYSAVPSDWTAQAYTLGSVVFYAGKQWYANTATVAGDIPNSSSKWTDITFDAIKTTLDDKANLSGGNSFTGNQQITGNISATGLATISGNVVGGGFIKTGAPATNLLVADGSDIPQSTFALASSAHNPVTIGTANGLSLSTQVLSLGLASSGVTGALSGTDWNTFNNKQNALTNPVTGTGATGQVSFWNGTNTQTGDNGLFWDNTNKRLGINTSAPSFMLSVDGANALASFRRNATAVTSSPKFLFTRTGSTLNTDITAGMQLGGVQFRALTGGIESDYSAFGYFANSTTVGDGVFKFLKSNLTSSVMDINSANGRIILQDGGTFTDNGVDRLQITGSAISTAWKTSGGASTDYVTGTGSLINFNSGVRTATLTGFVSGAGTVSATDTVLQAIQKLDGNISASASSGTYTPTFVAGSNSTSVVLFKSATYTKNGNIVNVRVDFTCNFTTSNVTTSFTMSLPFNRATSTNMFMGTGSAGVNSAGNSVLSVICQSINTDKVNISTLPIGGSAFSGSVVLQYSTLD